MDQPEYRSLDIIQVPDFDLPDRGRFEPNATIFQKRKLENFASSDRTLPERFYEMLDDLGRDQAQYIIQYCELRELAQMQADRLASRNLANQRALAEQEKSRRLSLASEDLADQRAGNRGFGWITKSVVLLIMWIAAAIYFVQKRTYYEPQSSESRSQIVQNTAPTPLALPTQNVLPARSQAPLATNTANAFLADVAYSQRAAVNKYPELGIKGSPLNAKFLTRYNQWKFNSDPRLNRSNWPEILAENCVAQ